MNFSLTPSRGPEKKGLDRLTDGKQSDPTRNPLFPIEVRNPKKFRFEHSLNIYLLDTLIVYGRIIKITKLFEEKLA